jgi:pimeloyl-ACP methyl ester carboxylesterase
MKYLNMYGVFYKYDIKRKRRRLKTIEWVFGIIILIIAGGFLFENISAGMDKQRLGLRGRMVQADEHKVFVRASGDGGATVIMESDIGGTYQEWQMLAAELSTNARVITYDRAGYGWSDSASSPRDMQQLVKELRAVIRRSSPRSPYILVGHGYGGRIMLAYAKEYPAEVEAVILIDTPTDEALYSEEYKQYIEKEMRTNSIYRFLAQVGVIRGAERLGLLKADRDRLEKLPEEGKALYTAHKVTPKRFKAIHNELSELKEAEEFLLEGFLGDKWLYVFTSIKDGASNVERDEIIASQEELLKLSNRSDHIIIEESSTYVHLDRPNAIVSTINDIIRRIR